MSTAPHSISKTALISFTGNAASNSAIAAVGAARFAGTHSIQQGDITHATSFLKSNPSPAWLIVEIPNTENAAEAAAALLDGLADVVNPSTRVIVTGSVDALSFYNWLMGIGVHDYLLAPIAEAALNASLTKHDNKNEPSSTSKTAAKPRHVMGFIGARGGVGTTTLATAAATIAARDYALPTVLADLDIYFGTSALGLDLEAGRGLRDALEKPERVDALFLERLMQRPFSPLSILDSEEPLHEPLTLHPQAGEILITTLRENYEVIVLDIPRTLDNLTRSALAASDTVCIVCEPTVASLRDALRLRDYTETHLKRKQVHLIVNREAMHPKQEIRKSDFTKHLGREPSLRIPFMAEIMHTTAQGECFAGNASCASATHTLSKWLAPLLGTSSTEQVAAAPKGLSALFKGKK